MPESPVGDDIEIKNISKTFGEFTALKDVSLNVKQGERVVGVVSQLPVVPRESP